MFLTTFQGTFSSFMAISVLNKEKIASLPRLLEAQEREEKEKKITRGCAIAQAGCAVEQSLGSLRYGAGFWRYGAGTWKNPINMDLIQKKKGYSF
jgi:hypothetical protein